MAETLTFSVADLLGRLTKGGWAGVSTGREPALDGGDVGGRVV